MAWSAVDICNLALTRLGASSISSLDETSTEAVKAKAVYDHVREATLRALPWGWATRTRALAQTAQTVPPWAFAYAYPSDCLEARRLVDPTSRNRHPPFTRASGGDGARLICTDLPRAVLVYTATITDLSVADPLFRDAMAWRLAAELAWPLTNSTDRANSTVKMYQTAIAQAAVANGNEAQAPEPDPATWLTARADLDHGGGR